MHAFEVLGDPVRRRILELLANGEHASGDVVIEVVRRSSDLSGRGVPAFESASGQWLRERPRRRSRRLYAIDTGPLREVDAWLDRFRVFWRHKLEALATEVARGKRARAKVKGR